MKWVFKSCSILILLCNFLHASDYPFSPLEEDLSISLKTTIKKLQDPNESSYDRHAIASRLGEIHRPATKKALLEVAHSELLKNQELIDIRLVEICIQSVQPMITQEDLEFLTELHNILDELFKKAKKQQSRTMLQSYYPIKELLSSLIEHQAQRPPLQQVIDLDPEQAQQDLQQNLIDAETKTTTPLKTEDSKSNDFFHAIENSKLKTSIRKTLRDAIYIDESADLERQADEFDFDLSDRAHEIDQYVQARIDTDIPKIPVFLGKAGVGKSTLTTAILRKILKKDFDGWHIAEEFFNKPFTRLKTKASLLARLTALPTPASQAAAMSSLLSALREAQSALGIQIELNISGIEQLTTSQLGELVTELERKDNPILIMGEGSQEGFTHQIKSNRELDPYFEAISVSQYTLEQTLKILKQPKMQAILKKYRVQVESDDLLKYLIEQTPEVLPNAAQLKGAIELLTKVAKAVSVAKKPSADQFATITELDVDDYISQYTGIPFSPKNPQKFIQFMNEVREKAKKIVIDQDHVVDALCDTIQESILAKAHSSVRSIAILGMTGNGKSLAVDTVAKLVYGKGGATDKILKIDGNAYSDKNAALTAFGVSNGMASADSSKGVIPTFLRGPGQSFSIIQFDEAEKAHVLMWERLMELLDQREGHGGLTAGDGQIDRGHHLVIAFTSNRGVSKILAPKKGEHYDDEELAFRAKNFPESQAREAFIEASTAYESDDAHKLKPEVVGRINRFVVSTPTTFNSAVKIVKDTAKKFIEQEMKGLVLNYDSSLLEAVTTVSFVLGDGPRPANSKLKEIFSKIRSNAWNAGLSAGDTINVTTEKLRSGSYNITVSYPKTGKQESFELQNKVSYQAIYDPRYRQKLMNLEDLLLKHAPGQQEIIKEIAQKYRGNAILRAGDTPLSFLLIGPESTGQQQIVEALASTFFHSSSRYFTHDLSDIMEPKDLWDLFSSKVGWVGSNRKGPFADFLNANNNVGGVIFFKNITAMGRGKSPAERKALFSAFEKMVSTGIHTDHHSNRYNLKNYTLVFSGDELSEYIYKQPSEDMQLTQYNAFKNNEKLSSTLHEQGIPRTFLSQLSGTYLMKPLNKNIRREMMKEALDRFKNDFKNNFGIELSFSNTFIENAVAAFCPMTQGYESIVFFVNRILSDTISNQILLPYFENLFTKKESSIKNLSLDFIYQIPEKPWYVDAPSLSTPRAWIKITGVLSANGGTHTQDADIQIDVQHEVAPRNNPSMMSVSDAELVAYHEIGHFLIGELLGNPNGKLQYITMQGTNDHGGYARYDSKNKANFPTLDILIKDLAGILAGGLFNEHFGFGRTTGWLSDLVELRTRVGKLVVYESMLPGFEYLKVNDEGKVTHQEPQSEQAIQRAGALVVQQAINLVHALLRDRELTHLADLGVKLLIEKGSATGDEARAATGLDQPNSRDFIQPILDDFFTRNGMNSCYQALSIPDQHIPDQQKQKDNISRRSEL